jgi:hypothetical protein
MRRLFALALAALSQALWRSPFSTRLRLWLSRRRGMTRGTTTTRSNQPSRCFRRASTHACHPRRKLI